MSRVLVIGAGGVGSVAVHKMAMNTDIFSHISLASRTKSKCDAIAASVKERTGVTIDTYEIDAEEVLALTRQPEARRQPCTALSGSHHHGRLPRCWRALYGHREL